MAHEVAAACETTGFLLVAGHGIPEQTVQDVVEAAERFFALSPDPAISRGYLCLAGSSLAQSRGGAAPPDLREGFSINRVDSRTDPSFQTPAAANLFAPNIWPAETDARFRGAMERYYLAIQSLSATLMRIFAPALDLPERFFDDKVDKHVSNLVAFHDPPLTQPSLPDQLRGSAPTDFGSLTLVHGHPSAEGLQVWSGSAWQDVPVVPGPSRSTSAISWRNGPMTTGSRPCTASSCRRNRPGAGRATRSCSSISRTTTR